MKRNLLKLSILVLLIVLTLTGCRAAQQKAATDNYAPAPQASYQGESLEKVNTGGFSYIVMADSTTHDVAERKMIMTARIELAANDLEGLDESVISLVQGYGGHIQRSFFNNKEGNQYWEFTLRIPSHSFETGIKEISALGKVQSSTASGQDVTEEHMDLTARLRVLQKEEERLLELLTKAVTIDDFLQVESHLSRVRVDIEQTTGRIKYLDNRIDFSTIELLVRPVQGMVEPDLKGFAGLAQQMKAAFRRGINGVVALIAGILVTTASLVPLTVILIPVALVLFLIVKRRRINRKPPQPPISM